MGIIAYRVVGFAGKVAVTFYATSRVHCVTLLTFDTRDPSAQATT